MHGAKLHAELRELNSNPAYQKPIIFFPVSLSCDVLPVVEHGTPMSVAVVAFVCAVNGRF